MPEQVFLRSDSKALSFQNRMALEITKNKVIVGRIEAKVRDGLATSLDLHKLEVAKERLARLQA